MLFILLFTVSMTFGQSQMYIWKNNVIVDTQTITNDLKISFNTSSGFTCGSSTVNYAGKTYHTVQIGTQCWLKENLDVGNKINGSLDQSNNGTIEKYCYDDILSNCTTYGGLYQWDEAMQYITDSSAQGICPLGWHLPTKTEIQTLMSAVNNNGNALKSVGQGTSSGQGTNTSGFSALLGGIRHITGVFGLMNTNVFFHSSTAIDGGTYDSAIQLFSTDSNITLEPAHRINGFPIRCLKN